VLKTERVCPGLFCYGHRAIIPNLIIGIVSALNGIPELSFGDVIGSNIFDISIVIGLAALLSRGGLSSSSKTVQTSALFTLFIALLPLLLVFDGILSRADGIILLVSFLIYSAWLFSKKEQIH
jgi:cation:H+ antiporter